MIPALWILCSLLFSGLRVLGSETNSLTASPKFLGSPSCSSTSCHGGAGDLSRQFTVWSHYDFHHERPFATLATARAERLADVLKIGKPAESPRCTVCHAPFQTVPADWLGKDAKISEGVSCESCHGPAENWLRSHTRKDYTHEDRVHAGLRDLKNIYVRANTCVACHQDLDADIRAAGHPELIFELDGQSVTMPRHWRKSEDKPGPQIWLVGQLVALREMQRPRVLTLHETNRPQEQSQLEIAKIERELGLDWLLSRADKPTRIRPETVQGPAYAWDDSFARKASTIVWSEDLTRACLKLLVNTSGEFVDKKLSDSAQARRAERLVLALDRLTLALPGAKTDAVSAALNRLFADAQSVPDFDPSQFAKDLKEFHTRVSGVLESK